MCPCPAPEDDSAPGTKNSRTATSAAGFGGMAALVTAARKEGRLNAITLPRDWADYGAIIDGFKKNGHAVLLVIMAHSCRRGWCFQQRSGAWS